MVNGTPWHWLRAVRVRCYTASMNDTTQPDDRQTIDTLVLDVECAHGQASEQATQARLVRMRMVQGRVTPRQATERLTALASSSDSEGDDAAE